MADGTMCFYIINFNMKRKDFLRSLILLAGSALAVKSIGQTAEESEKHVYSGERGIEDKQSWEYYRNEADFELQKRMEEEFLYWEY